MATALARAAEAFRAVFSTDPTHSASAPGRINLIGEHTDYNGGLVLPTPINLHCVAVGAPTIGQSRLIAADLNKSFTFDHTRDLMTYVDADGGIPKGHWASYIIGVLHGHKQRGYTIPAVNIAIASDIPIGSGLSSSAALEAATANLLNSITSRALDPLDKARLCRTAEHSFAGVPCGIMDQYTVILGRPGYALLIDCKEETSEPVPLPPPEKATIVIIDTMVRHKLASGEYAARRAICNSAATKLGVKVLSDASISQLGHTALTDDERRCATHVLLENARVRGAVDALRSADLPALGQLMYESHKSLRDDYRVSCPELDTIVDIARAAPGVYGARMTGAGFGGCAIALVDPAALTNTSAAITADFEQAHGHSCRVFLAADP
jgi:galactokinase